MASPLRKPSQATPDLREAIRAILSPSWRAQAVIDAMLLAREGIGTAGAVARRMGFRNRFELARWFARQGLPPMHELAGWISVLSWLERWERLGITLCRGALREGRDPGACYRLVRRITGASWGEVQAAGLGAALDRFALRCRVVRHRWTRLELATLARSPENHRYVHDYRPAVREHVLAASALQHA